MKEGRLILVPTPIGNLRDITLRAIDILTSCDLVLAEDTRHTRSLLSHLELTKNIESLHQNNEHQRVEQLALRIQNDGLVVAYCTDAGTPGISDPGYLLVRACLDHQIFVECLPGATAFVPALVVSGLPSDRFVFEGFLPHKKGRKTRMERIASEQRTSILYESTHRILKLLDEIELICGSDREISVSRELTKLHETHYRGSVSEVKEQLKNDVTKGEFVVLIKGTE